MSNLTGNYKISAGEVQGVDVVREREQERLARMQLLDDIREPSPQPIFGEPVKVDLEDETSRRIKNTLGDFTQVLINDPKNLIGISRSTTSGHLMNGHPSNGYSASGHPVNGYSVAGHPGGHQTTGHATTGHPSTGHPPAVYSSNGHAMAAGHSMTGNLAMGHTSSSYGRTQAAFKKTPYIVNGASVPKPSMPNFISPKAPDKRLGYNKPDKLNYSYKPESPVTAPKTFHTPSLQQTTYQMQETRVRDSAVWDAKDQRRTNSTPVAVNINVNVESNTNVTINNINVSNNSISTSAPIWNCGPDTPAIQLNPFHLPASATPSVPSKTAASHGQTSTSYSSTPAVTKYEPASSTPAKRNTVRPSNLKIQIQPERKSSTEAPIAVETILKEMTKAVPQAPLTAIQTPRTEETGFAFPAEPKEDTSFLKENSDIITPLDDPLPNDDQSLPKPWSKSPDTKPGSKVSLAECKVTDSATYELSKQWKPATSNVHPQSAPAPSEPTVVAAPERLGAEGAASTANVGDFVKYAPSLRDDLALSESDDEVVPEVKANPEQYLKSPVINNSTTVNNTTVSTNNNTMNENSAESSNSSSSESGDSDSDDSSSESNDSDSSSEASDEEISSKKWGLSNFVDESQRIHSPAFFHADAAAKESFRLHAERIKNFGLGNVNPVNGTPFISPPVTETATFLVPDVPVASKNEILSPILSPVHPIVGPRTPPSPAAPLKQDSPETNDDVEPLNSQVDSKSHEDISKLPIQSSSPQSDEPQDNCDISEEKGNVQNEKCKKQLRSCKAKSEELSSEVESPPMVDPFADEPSSSKESSETPLEKEDVTKGTNKTISVPVTPEISETSTENYPIKTRQRVSAASAAKKKSNVDTSSENSQKAESTNSPAIAKLKHPRACRKSNEKQIKKATSNLVSTKPDSNDDPKRHNKQEANENISSIVKVKNIPKTADNTTTTSKTHPVKTSVRSKGKISKMSPKKSVEVKKPEVKKKKKKFAIENFLQSAENESVRPPSALTPFTPSPERSPIPECKNNFSEKPSEPSVPPSAPPSVPSKAPCKSNSKSTEKVKKVEKLRRSVRCSERASNNAQVEPSVTPQLSTENKRNSKNVGKTKRHAENMSVSIEPSVELLSPIPHDPPLSTQISDCAIPLKIMVSIPLSLLSRLPSSFQQTQESTVRPVSKSNSSGDEAKVQKKDSSEKAIKSTAAKSSQSKDQSKDKSKVIVSLKNDKSNAKNVSTGKKEKIVKTVKESSAKSKTASNVNKNIKVKDKTLSDDAENKLPKKRKSENVEKQIVKKPKLSSRMTDDRKLKEPSTVSKTDSTANQIEEVNKSKALERCDSTGSLSSLCSQQSQRSSKSAKERKKECSTGGPEAKRIKTSTSPMLSVKDIKQEKLDRAKIHSSLDKATVGDKIKSKPRDKLGTKDMIGNEHFWDDSLSSSQYCHWEEQCKEDSKGKLLGPIQSLSDTINRELADWDHFAPEMHKELKEASALNKHNNQAPIMPMDYYWTEGKKQKCLAEKEKDPFQQAVKFFEAAVLFILTSQQREEYSKDPDSVYQFYRETLKFYAIILSRVKKLQTCPGGTEFKLLILCLKCQSLLNVKLYNLKIKEIKEQLDGVTDFLQHQCSTATSTHNSTQSHQSRLTSLSSAPSPHSTIPSPASSNSQNSYSFGSDRSSVSVPQSILDTICRQHTHLINLHRGHDLWEQADMYMTRSNLREFFKEVADQSEPLTLHSSITELVKYIQKGISLVKKSLR